MTSLCHTLLQPVRQGQDDGHIIRRPLLAVLVLQLCSYESISWHYPSTSVSIHPRSGMGYVLHKPSFTTSIPAGYVSLGSVHMTLRTSIEFRPRVPPVLGAERGKSTVEKDRMSLLVPNRIILSSTEEGSLLLPLVLHGSRSSLSEPFFRSRRGRP